MIPTERSLLSTGRTEVPHSPRRLGLIAPPISGHLNPALALARELHDRGHAVAYFGFLDAESKVRAAGIDFVPVSTDGMPRGSVPALMRRQGELTGLAALRWILHCLQQENLRYLRDLHPALAAWRPEALLIDQIAYGAGSIAQKLGLPYVTLCNALPVHADLSVPPFATDWRPQPGRRGRVLTWLASLPLRPLLRHHFRPLDQERRKLGLPLLRPETLADSPLAILSQQPVGFEFLQRQFPGHFHLTGPWQRPATREPFPFPYERLDGRPLIYASLGTLQNRIEPIFRAIAEAIAPLDAQLVLALGATDASIPANLPGSPVVVPFAPQLELLRRASLVITHAGLNTALESLAHGVPMVAIPIANDQPGVAARIRACGAGEFLPLRRLTAPRLRRLVGRVLADPAYLQAARRMQRQIQEADGLSHAAELIERVIASAQTPSAARVAPNNRASAPGATQHQSPRLLSRSSQCLSVGT